MNNNLKFLVTITGVLCALWSTAHAEDNTTNIISGTFWNAANTNYAVGFTGTSNYLEINSAGQLTNAAAVYIGSNSTATANSALVTGTGSVLYDKGAFYMGYLGSSNSLTIANGGTITNNTGYIGGNTNNNTVLVTDTNSLWQNGNFYVGNSKANNNSLTISNGGVVRCLGANDYIGATTATNNAVLVTGPGSSWQMSGDLRVGNSGMNNTLTIANGGRVTNYTQSLIGNTAGGEGNRVLVADTNSIWQSYGTIHVGPASGNNSLTISNGGVVFATNAIIVGNGSGVTSNTLSVIGPGSKLTLNTASASGINTGGGGTYNRLIITNGGTVNNTGANYIAGPGSSSVLVTDTNSLWSAGSLFMGNAGTNHNLTITNGGVATFAQNVIEGNNVGGGHVILVTGSGSKLSAAGTLNVGWGNTGGSFCPSNQLIVANGGIVTNTGASYMGFTFASSNNTALVTGTGSLWATAGNAYIGGSTNVSATNYSVGNIMILTNGGVMNNVIGYLGYTNSCSNNTVLVTGSGSTWRNGSTLVVGNAGAGNSLTISNGGLVTNTTAQIGNFAAGNNNTVLVTGSGSTWRNGSTLTVGSAGAGNNLTIAMGGYVTNTGSLIGQNSANNTVLVTDTNSFWQGGSANDVQVGGSGAGNSLIISNGASAKFTVSSGFYISASAGASNNSVLVTGPGSLLQNGGNLFKVGNNGTGNNSLTIANGGTFSNSSSMVIPQTTAGNNSNTVTITGAGSTLIQANTGITVGSATTTNNALNVLNGGLITNVSTVTLLSGAINSVFNLGNGTTTATVMVNSVNLNDASARMNFNAGRLVGTLAGKVINGIGSVYIQSGGAEIDSQNFSLSITNPLLQDGLSTGGGLTKLGTGTLTLSGTNTYTGTTLVSAGKLVVSTVQNGGGTFTVNDGASLGVVRDATVTSLAASSLTLGNTTGGTVEFTLPASNPATESITAGILTLNGASTVKIYGTFTVGQFPLIKYTSLVGPESSLTNGTPRLPTGVVGSIVHNPGNSSFDLKITSLMGGPITTLMWAGTVNSTWDVVTTANWTDSSGSVVFSQGENVTLDDTAPGSTSVTLSGTLQPSALIVNNTNKSYTLGGSGSLSGSMSLTKAGTNTLTISTANTFTGSTTINGGGVLVNADSGLGTAPGSATPGQLTLNNGALVSTATFTLNANRGIALAGPGGQLNVAAGTLNYGGIATGAAGLEKAGTGSLTLFGTNTYSGPTLLTAGILSINNIDNGGANSALGASSSAAANLTFNGGTLSYTGPDASSDRSFTMFNGGTNTIDVSSAATLTLSGSSPTNTGLLQKTGVGSLILDPGVGTYSVGSLAASGGILTLKAGTFTTTGLDPIFAPVWGVGVGVAGGRLVINGATLNVTGSKFLSVGPAFTTGYLDVLSGTVNATSGLFIGHHGTATVTQSGGQIITPNVSHGGQQNGTNIITGGTLTTQKIFNNNSTNTFMLLLNGGTVQAAAGTVNLMDNYNGGPTNTQVTVQLGTNGTTIDTSLSSATIARPLDDIPGQAGQLIKIGANTLTLTSNNTYTGSTTVSNGTLLVNGLISTGAVVVKTGATLGGIGTLGGSVTFDAGASARFTNGGHLAISGALTASDNAVQLYLSNNVPVGSYQLATFASSSGTFSNTPTIVSGSLAANTYAVIQTTSTNVVLQVVASSPTALALSSSSQTNGYLDSVAFTASISPTNATGWVVFATNSVALETNAVVAGLATSSSLNTLPRGTNLITAIYSGDAYYLASTNSLLQVVTNHPPAANNNTYSRGPASVWQMAVSDLLTNATDSIDGDALSLDSVGTSSNGILPVVSGGYVSYTNASLVADQFTYTVTDGFGGTSSGVISLTASNSVPGTSSIAGVITGNPTTLTAYGIAGYTYITERATNLTQVPWEEIATNLLTGTNVVISVTDSNPPAGEAYYRLKWQQ